MIIKYCKKCFLPSSRPNLVVDENGVCNACSSGSLDPNWSQRAIQFETICEESKSRNKPYDCLIPVSGGKDSTWQTLKALEYGLKPLCVTWRTPARTVLGQKNLDNLIALGVDHFDITLNPILDRHLTRRCFEEFGSPAIPMHAAIHFLPVNVAIKFDIPLIIWGENSAKEYGGSQDLVSLVEMTDGWYQKYSVTDNASDDIYRLASEISLECFSASYMKPNLVRARELDITPIFLGSFFEWDPEEMYRLSSRFGFQAASKPEVGFYSFADIDDAFIMAVHHWMKWFKFGFTRDWDNVAQEIRRGRISRSDARLVIHERSGREPTDAIKSFCEYTGMSRYGFDQVCEKFRSSEVWQNTGDHWEIKGFLFDDFQWEKKR